MAYPAEKTHVEYLKYLERWSNGEEEGPKMSKEQWLEKNKQKSPKSVLQE